MFRPSQRFGSLELVEERLSRLDVRITCAVTNVRFLNVPDACALKVLGKSKDDPKHIQNAEERWRSYTIHSKDMQRLIHPKIEFKRIPSDFIPCRGFTLWWTLHSRVVDNVRWMGV